MPLVKSALLVAILCFLSTAARADEPGTGFWAGADVGYGALERSYSLTGSARDNTFALSLRGGYAWHPQLLLGVELGGWLLQASDYNGSDPSRGEAIETFLVMAQYYLGREAPYFIRAGVGGAQYWTNHAGEQSGSGPAAMLGAGRDFRMSDSWNLTLAADYSGGRLRGVTSPPGVTQDATYRVLTFRVGLTYR